MIEIFLEDSLRLQRYESVIHSTDFRPLKGHVCVEWIASWDIDFIGDTWS